MKEKIVGKGIIVLDWLIFLSAAMTVAVIGYEGLTMTNYQTALFIPVMVMDYSFILSVLLQFVMKNKKKVFFCFNIANLFLIITAYVMKFAGMDYAPWTLLFWDMYLMLYFGYRIASGKQVRGRVILESEE